MKAQILALACLAVLAFALAASPCPEEDGEYAVYIRDPYNCSSYYVCGNGEAHPMACPDGLHWNVWINTCDWPVNAKCKPITLE